MPTGDEALLVVEGSDSTYVADLNIKLPIYADAGVPNYWIVDVNSRRVEVYQHPSCGQYSDVTFFEEGAFLPVAFEGCPAIAVSDLFVTVP